MFSRLSPSCYQPVRAVVRPEPGTDSRRGELVPDTGKPGKRIVDILGLIILHWRLGYG
jgi:hypothetical protein